MAAHEEQDERVVLLAGVVAVGGSAICSSGGTRLTTIASRRRRATRCADVIGRCAAPRPGSASARGFSGTPSRGHCVAAAISASCTASSAAAKSRKRRTTAPSTCGASSRSRCSARASSGGDGHSRSSGGPLITCRTSIAMLSGSPPGPGAADALAAICVGALGALDVDDPVAGEELLGLGEHAVGDRPAVLAGAHELGLVGAGQALGGDELARLAELLVEALHELDVRLEVLLRPVGDLVRPAARGVHHQHVLHGRLLLKRERPGIGCAFMGRSEPTADSRHPAAE